MRVKIYQNRSKVFELSSNMCKNTIKVVYGYSGKDEIAGMYKEICKRGWYDEVNSVVSKPLPDDYELETDDYGDTLLNWINDFITKGGDTKAGKYIHRNIEYGDFFTIGIVVCEFEAGGKIKPFSKPESFPFDDIDDSKLDFYTIGGVCETCYCVG